MLIILESGLGFFYFLSVVDLHPKLGVRLVGYGGQFSYCNIKLCNRGCLCNRHLQLQRNYRILWLSFGDDRAGYPWAYATMRKLTLSADITSLPSFSVNIFYWKCLIVLIQRARNIYFLTFLLIQNFQLILKPLRLFF